MSLVNPGSKTGSALRIAVVISALAAAATPAVRAQEDGGLVGGIPVQFSLVPPGARSLGLGGAFIGSANDATAAWSNPAGLVNLFQPEVSLEFRHVSTSGGEDHYSIQIPPDETIVKFDYDDANEFSFASWVLPRERWALAIYYHELASQSAFGESKPCSATDTPSNPDSSCGGKVGGATFRFNSNLDIAIPGVGASFGFKISDQWRLGLGATYYKLDLTSRYSSLNQRTNSTRRVESDDDSLGGVLGVQWQGEEVAIGAVYRIGPSFSTISKRLCGGYGTTPESALPVQCPGASGFIPSEKEQDFSVPDSYGIGLSWQATPSFSVAFDVVRTEYSALSDVQQLNSSNKTVEYVVDDATEPHLGLAYAFKIAAERFLNVRAGAWLEADHRLRYPHSSFIGAQASAQGISQTIDRVYPSEKADAELHSSLGVGLTLGLKFQLDFAVDFSSLADTASLSGVYRF